MSFELEAQKLLSGGGIKNKEVQKIREASRVVRDKIDDVLEELFKTEKLSPQLFMTSDYLAEIWKDYLTNDNGF